MYQFCINFSRNGKAKIAMTETITGFCIFAQGIATLDHKIIDHPVK